MGMYRCNLASKYKNEESGPVQMDHVSWTWGSIPYFGTCAVWDIALIIRVHHPPGYGTSLVAAQVVCGAICKSKPQTSKIVRYV